MGAILSGIFDALTTFPMGGSEDTRVLMLGLDGAGKTTILYKVKLNENVHTIPTIGFNVETMSPINGLTFTVFDVGGQEKIRALWRHYFVKTQGLLYIVDSADWDRMEEAREELCGIIESPEMAKVPVVVVANKQDLPEALHTSEIADRLGLRGIKDRKWFVQGACAVSGKGVCEAMMELARLVKEFQKT
ncbi:ADP-ribosylation factor-like [Elysia marginata]|uniref:ADP-ribosylation factor-like n=1 Tax=Elysia marginata TaxID=1093978 RepID=A0AAV4GTY6_9GAST|nr:ADP-ribosylation factor-like [Elysia marginata]